MEQQLILIKLIQNLKNKGFNHFSLEKEWWNNAENLNYAVEKKIYYPLIYSKEFGEFFFSKEPILVLEKFSFDHAWHFHFQQMVISDDPLVYLEKFIHE